MASRRRCSAAVTADCAAPLHRDTDKTERLKKTVNWLVAQFRVLRTEMESERRRDPHVEQLLVRQDVTKKEEEEEEKDDCADEDDPSHEQKIEAESEFESYCSTMRCMYQDKNPKDKSEVDDKYEIKRAVQYCTHFEVVTDDDDVAVTSEQVLRFDLVCTDKFDIEDEYGEAWEVIADADTSVQCITANGQPLQYVTDLPVQYTEKQPMLCPAAEMQPVSHEDPYPMFEEEEEEEEEKEDDDEVFGMLEVEMQDAHCLRLQLGFVTNLRDLE